MLKLPARKVVTEPITAPSMMPTSGTMIEDRTATRRSTPRKIIVPTNAAALARTIRTIGGAPGHSRSVTSTPRPAHWLVPAVVGSTNLFWVVIRSEERRVGEGWRVRREVYD